MLVEGTHQVECVRKDEDDEVYRSAAEKYEAVAALIEEARKTGQPYMVGTTSIEKSETISEILKKKKVPARGAECALSTSRRRRSWRRRGRRVR